MDRVRRKTVEEQIDLLNRGLGLNPKPWSTKRMVANVGTFVLDIQHEGYRITYAIEQIVNEGGGSHRPFITERMNSRECYYYLLGLNAWLRDENAVNMAWENLHSRDGHVKK